MRRKPRANSLTYRNKKKDGVTLHMSYDMPQSALIAAAAAATLSSANSSSDENV